MSEQNSDGCTEIVCVVDKSGSMGRIRDDAIGGFNSFLEAQKEEDGEARFSLTLFDTSYEQIYDGVPIEEVEPLDHDSYRPDGSTALLDAVGRTIHAVTYRIEDAPDEERPDQVIFLILTDGKENSSEEYRRDQIGRMIGERRREERWEFIFLAANIDAFAAAEQYNIDQSRVTQFAASGEGVQAAYDSAGAAVTSIRRDGELTDDWRDEPKTDRKSNE